MSEEDIEKLDTLDRGKDGAVTWNPVDVDWGTAQGAEDRSKVFCIIMDDIYIEVCP